MCCLLEPFILGEEKIGENIISILIIDKLLQSKSE